MIISLSGCYGIYETQRYQPRPRYQSYRPIPRYRPQPPFFTYPRNIFRYRIYNYHHRNH